MLLSAVGTHMLYVMVSVALGAAAGMILGIVLSRVPKWSVVILPILSVFQTIPGLAFIGILFLITGMKPITVIIALSVYVIFPVLKNTYAGILSVEDKYVEAAKGCGMTSFQTLMRVELPLASPTITAGLRMAVIYTIKVADRRASCRERV